MLFASTDNVAKQSVMAKYEFYSNNRELNNLITNYRVEKIKLLHCMNFRYSKDRVKHDSFRVFNAFVTRFSCVCMKRVLKRVDSRFSRYKRVSQQPIKSALQ